MGGKENRGFSADRQTDGREGKTTTMETFLFPREKEREKNNNRVLGEAEMTQPRKRISFARKRNISDELAT